MKRKAQEIRDTEGKCGCAKMEAEIALMHLQSGVYWNPQKMGETSRARALSGNTNMPTFKLR